MFHPIHKVKQFEIVAPFTLLLTFDDGCSREVDFSPVLSGEVYGPLQDVSTFNAVQIDSEVHTLVWPNGAEFDPETLYNWDEYIAELREGAAAWSNGGDQQ